MSIKTVLITGTTSGLGYELLKHYSKSGWNVIAVNRREPDDYKNFKNTNFKTLDITDSNAVGTLIDELCHAEKIPDTFILNAGINKPDNIDKFDLLNFQEVLEVNINGVLTFVAEIQKLNLIGRRIIAISSMSRIVPNPEHLGYHISKFSVKRLFDLANSNDTGNQYKTVTLGPVRTNLNRYMRPQSKLQKWIFKWLEVDPKKAVKDLSRFFENNRKHTNYPLKALSFFASVRLFMTFVPIIYLAQRRR